MSEPTSPTTPAWNEFFARVGSPEWLTAKALLELDPQAVVRNDAARWLCYAERAGYRDRSGVWHAEPELDWDAWVADVDDSGRGWSSTQWRLFNIVAGLTTGRPFNIVGTLDLMGAWKSEVWLLLVEWGTGGDNRERSGRSLAARRRGV